MGVYINPGNEGFAAILRSDYVDKTGIIAKANFYVGRARPLVCVSRPRRFGKSFAAQALTAYYSCGCDSTALFDGLAVSRDASYAEHLNAYNVIRLDMTPFTAQFGARVVERVSERLVGELTELFPETVRHRELDLAILDVVRSTNRKFVFIIDEWDAPLREDPTDAEGKEAYVKWLRLLFKNASFTAGAVALAYMTGILPIIKYGTQSALSEFEEFTMVEPYEFSPYVGFLEDEVRAVCESSGMDFEEMRRWYDGYELPGAGHVYSPFSVGKAVARHHFASYWVATSAYDSLLTYIREDFDGLQGVVADLIAGKRVPVSTEAFKNDLSVVNSADDVLTVLIHLGYLSYDSRTGAARIPNEEVLMEWARTIRESDHPVTRGMVADADALLKAVVAEDAEAVAEGVARAHDARIGPDWYHDEQSLRFAVKLAFLTAVDKYAEIEELPSGHGRADVVYLPKRYSDLPAMVVELKWDKDPSTALDQIRERDYPKVLRDYGGPLLLVGVTYDSKTKRHSCQIERVRTDLEDEPPAAGPNP